MPHWAQVDGDNVVQQVLRTNTEDYPSDAAAVEWLEANVHPGPWIRTYYDTPGKVYAGRGWTYVPEDDTFLNPNPPEETP